MRSPDAVCQQKGVMQQPFNKFYRERSSVLRASSAETARDDYVLPPDNLQNGNKLTQN